MNDGVYVVRGGETFEVRHGWHDCRPETCDLFRSGVCDAVFDVANPALFPCDQLWQTLQTHVGAVGNVLFKRVGEVAK